MYTVSVRRIRATVKMRRWQLRQTLCCRRRKGRSMSRPPSCTTHQTSIFPFIRSTLLGYQLIPFGTKTASSLLVATRIASVWENIVRLLENTIL